MTSPSSEHEAAREDEHEDLGEHEDRPANPPEPPPTPPHAEGGDRLDRLEGIVNGLVDIVAALAPKDEAPTKTPWTHRGSARDER